MFTSPKYCFFSFITVWLDLLCRFCNCYGIVWLSAHLAYYHGLVLCGFKKFTVGLGSVPVWAAFSRLSVMLYCGGSHWYGGSWWCACMSGNDDPMLTLQQSSMLAFAPCISSESDIFFSSFLRSLGSCYSGIFCVEGCISLYVFVTWEVCTSSSASCSCYGGLFCVEGSTFLSAPDP